MTLLVMGGCVRPALGCITDITVSCSVAIHQTMYHALLHVTPGALAGMCTTMKRGDSWAKARCWASSAQASGVRGKGHAMKTQWNAAMAAADLMQVHATHVPCQTQCLGVML